MPKFETIPLAEVKLKKRISAELLPMVDKVKKNLEDLDANQAGRFVLEKGDDASDLRKVIRFAAESMNKRIRFPFRGEEGSLTFYLDEQKRRGRPPKSEAAATPGKRKRGRPRKVTG